LTCSTKQTTEPKNPTTKRFHQPPLSVRRASSPSNGMTGVQMPWSCQEARDKPILLDIGRMVPGCHVIDPRGGYGKSPISTNQSTNIFVPVKVDSERAPDVDSRYPAAISAQRTRRWHYGFLMRWQPFLAATYFPREGPWGAARFRPQSCSPSPIAYPNKRGDL